ncbi:TonB-dependent receptor [Marinicauda salina]|uniref:TonB-dependent receptor n=1 Tax=Marinicauda salina TaxID=2135793 RepID=A0A2U2BRX4_9PROT|nr:TonB-dependent receptor [Marinicauda salina]PWE16739.1 TonB-dependent receptor [Marinicauda salina]
MSRVLFAVAGLAAVVPSALAQEEAPHEEGVLRGETIVVSGTPLARSLGETITGTTVLEDEDLARRAEGSIGETLRYEPGVSSTFFGPAASRPVIRGLGGDRIRVLDAGIGSIDASATSPDHAVAVEPALAERIEIVRGSSMLLYGSSAAGGVVNVFDGRIPSEAPEDGLEAGFNLGYSSVDEGYEAAGAVNATIADNGARQVVLHADAFWRDSGDYEIPGFAEAFDLRVEEAIEAGETLADHQAELERGVVENSFHESEGGSLGGSVIWANGFIGVNARVINSFYGVPGGHGHGHGHEEEEHAEGEAEEELVSIDLEQTRYDLRGEIDTGGYVETVKLRAGYGEYEHTELEGDEVGTVFTNEAWEARVELVERPHGPDGAFRGATGVQLRGRDFEAVGAEAFVPPVELSQLGVFTLREYRRGDWVFDGGVRYERTEFEPASGAERSFDGLSVSAGAGVNATDELFLGVTAFRTERAPATEELYSNGPHLATNAFELGDPDLGEEIATGIEASARWESDRFGLTANVFHTTYEDFIYEAATGAEMDALPVFAFRAADADFSGFELQGEAEIGRAHIGPLGDVDFHVDGTVSYVDASLDAVGEDELPRIPPLTALVGFDARGDRADFRIEAQLADEQDDVTAFETPTEAWAAFNAFVTVHPVAENHDIALEFAAKNVTDAEARLHTSFLKNLAPLPGRSFEIRLRTRF